MPLDNINNEVEQNPVFNDDRDIYGKTPTPIIAPKREIGIDTDNTLLNNVANAAISSKLDMSALQSFTRVSQNRNQIYDTIDVMCNDSTIAAILETYAEDATEYNEQGKIVWVESDDADVYKHVDYLLETMRVDKHIYKWVHALCKYGDVYLRLYRESDFNKNDIFSNEETDTQKDLRKKLSKLEERRLGSDNSKPLNEDVVLKAYSKNDHFVNYLELVKNPAEMFELTRFGKTAGYISADLSVGSYKQVSANDNMFFNQYKFKRNDVKVYSATEFVHASLEDNSSRIPEEVDIYLDDKAYTNNDDSNAITYTVKRGQSLFQNVFKVWRELTLLENSVMLNRVTKSAITRLINVEVGDMPKEMVGPHLQGIKSLMEQKAALNEGNSLTEYTNPGPAENNIYVPTNGGKGTITATTVGGDVQVGDLVDLDYFKNKFFGAMRVPKQYFGDTDDGAGFNGGQSLSIISSRYAKMIKRIQNTMIQAITDAINLLLLDRNLDRYIGKFTIRMLPPTTQEEIDRRDNMANKIQIASDIMTILSDIEDPTAKLKMLKSLLSNIITDGDIVNILQEEIDKMEAAAADNPQDPDDESVPTEGEDLGAGEPLNLNTGGTSMQGVQGDQDYSEDDSAPEGGVDSEENDDTALPSPEELDIGDMSDNNNPNLML